MRSRCPIRCMRAYDTAQLSLIVSCCTLAHARSLHTRTQSRNMYAKTAMLQASPAPAVPVPKRLACARSVAAQRADLGCVTACPACLNGAQRRRSTAHQRGQVGHAQPVAQRVRRHGAPQAARLEEEPRGVPPKHRGVGELRRHLRRKVKGRVGGTPNSHTPASLLGLLVRGTSATRLASP